MPQNSVKATIILRNDLADNWESRNPVLSRGELAAEIDTGLLKIGDGITSFSGLDYINLGRAPDGALLTLVNDKITIADYGKSYWKYDEESARDVEVVESDLTQWPSVVQLEVKNNTARWVQPKINYNISQGKIDGALITLTRDPLYSNEASTKNYVDTKVAAAIANAPHLQRQVVTELPASNFDDNTIYMIRDDSISSGDMYKEYIVIDNALVQIGDTSVDLSGYVEKPTNYTQGNVVAFGADGILVDTGVAANTLNVLQPATYSTLGGVKSSTADDYISVDNVGFMHLNRVATDRLYVPNGSEFIINGGQA